MSIRSIDRTAPFAPTPEYDPDKSAAARAVDPQGRPPAAPREPNGQPRGSQANPQRRGVAHALLRQYSVASPHAQLHAAGQPSIGSPPAEGAGPMSGTQFASVMVDRYDGGAHSRNEAADRHNTLITLQTARLTMTGLPPDQQQMNLDELQFAGALAQMSDDKRERFAQRANALRTAPDDQYAGMLASLQSDVNAELDRVEADPVLRMNAIFNAPAGIAILGDDGQKQMAALRSEYANMNRPGTTPGQREQAFAKACEIKSGMQDQILQKSQDVHATQQKLWSESDARVNQILDDAEKYSADTIQLPRNSDDPQWDTDTRKPAYAKTFPYQSVMEKLLSPDGYSQQERGRSTPRTLSPEDRARDLLTFQQGMSEPGSDIHKRVTKLEQQALSTMAQPGPDLDAVKPATTLGDVAAHPPSYDKDYIRNLAARYKGALTDFDEKNRAMLREHIPGLADKILYGTGRFLADLSPIPGMDWFAGQLLDAEYPDHGGLTDEQVKYTDMSAMIFGVLLGRREPEGEGILKPPVAGGGEPPPGGATQIRDPHVSTPQTDPTGTGVQGQPATGAATTPNRFTPGGMPGQYAHTPNGNLQADSNSPGVFRDSRGDAYIYADGQTLPVRYDRDNDTWRVFQRENPSKYQYPVKLDERGNWQVHDDVGLKGGAPDQANRDKLSNALSTSSTVDRPGSYPSSVDIVNELLRRTHVSLSDQSADAIISNLKKLDAGEIAHAQASVREVWTFARDVADLRLSMKDRAAAALGMVINGVLAPGYMAQFDLGNYHFGRNQSADLRQAMHLFVQFDPHS